MSIQAVSWALEQNVPDPSAKLVLIALANAFNQQRQRCFPTIRQLMTEASTSERTVQRKLRALADMGLIVIEKIHDETGRQKANEYVLNLKGEGVRLTGGGCQDGTGEGVTGDGGEGANCDTPYKEPEEIPEESSLGASAPDEPAEPDDFEEFWNAYPKREGPNPKKPARLKFTRLVANGADPKRMIAAAKELARHHPKPTRFCPQAVTWLNQERFADADAAPPVAKAEDAAEWAKRLKIARLSKRWWSEWGPMPHAPGCRVPGEMIQPSDGDLWSERRRSA